MLQKTTTRWAETLPAYKWKNDNGIAHSPAGAVDHCVIYFVEGGWSE